MSKVFVDRELLEQIVNTNMADYAVIAYQHKEIRSILAQPAEAEGAVEMGSDAWMALHLLDRLDVSADEEPRVQQVEEIVRRMGAALSAVTAERDRLRDVLEAIANLPMDRCSTDNDYRLSAAKAIALGALSAPPSPAMDAKEE